MDSQALLNHFTLQTQALRQGLQRVIVSHDEAINLLLICCLTDSHALLVGPPGVAKTLMVKALAHALDWKFSRVQCTPDLMPADITGYELLGRDGADGELKMMFRPGPVFANLLLADEINRAVPRTQSALLEAMAEHQVTLGGITHNLPDPFIVVATQNPIEMEGTYPLPEAQLDRFMMRIDVGYPTTDQEQAIVQATRGTEIALPEPVMSRDTFVQLRELVRAVPVADSVVAFAVRLCSLSRPGAGAGAGAGDAEASSMVKDFVAWGAGPRGSQNLIRAAKVTALLDGRVTPTVQDVRAVAMAVLTHRIFVNHRAMSQGITAKQIVDHLLIMTKTS